MNLEDKLRERFKHISADCLRANVQPHSQPPRPVVECSAGVGPLATKEVKAGYTGRFLVRVTSFRVRLIDEDNLCEKYVVDCCRYAGLLPADSPDQTKIEVAQVKVAHKNEERTVIEVTPP